MSVSKIQRLERRNLILAGVAVVLGAILLFRAPASAVVDTEDLPRVLADVNPETVLEFSLTQGESELVLGRSGEGWVVRNRFDVAADASQASRLVDALPFLRQRRQVTARAETFAKYAPAEGWTEVVVKGASGVVARFAVGKETTPYPDVYLRVGEGPDARVIHATKISRDMVSTRLGAWVEERLWPKISSEAAIRVDVQRPDDEVSLILAKRGESPADVEVGVPEADKDDPENVWWMVEPTEGNAHRMEVENLTRSFAGTRLEDIVASSVSDASLKEYGLLPPKAVVTLRVKDLQGAVEQRTLRIGAQVGTARYVMKDGTSHVYKVPGYNLTDFFRDPEDFRNAPVEPEDPAPEDGGDREEASGDPDAPGDAPPPAPATGDPDAPGDAPPPAPVDPEDPDKPADDPAPSGDGSP